MQPYSSLISSSEIAACGGPCIPLGINWGEALNLAKVLAMRNFPRAISWLFTSLKKFLRHRNGKGKGVKVTKNSLNLTTFKVTNTGMGKFQISKVVDSLIRDKLFMLITISALTRHQEQTAYKILTILHRDRQFFILLFPLII